MKTSMSSIFIFVPPLAAWVQGQPADDRPRTHACERPLPLCGGSFTLSAVTSARLPQVTFAPGSSKDRGKTPMPTAAGPAPDHPGPNKVTGSSLRSPEVGTFHHLLGPVQHMQHLCGAVDTLFR